jgi:predicted phosphodiesterase
MSLLLLPTALVAQHEPYVVYDTKPVILHGPYLVAPTETSAVIVWATDTPSHSKVLYGHDALDHEATNVEHGLLPVGTVHSVALRGLTPGQIYQYRVVSTRVVRLKPYYPDMGLTTESRIHSFETFDRDKTTTAFSVVTDTHEDVKRIEELLALIDWDNTDFLVHTGDAFDEIESEDQVFERWVDPVTKPLDGSKPLIYARGNHETRGSYARELFRYVPVEEGRYYYARDNGPVHLIVVDTGEDKPDDTSVYAGLNDFRSFRQQEFLWLEEHAKQNRRMTDAPFRVVVMHQPVLGEMEGDGERWNDWANTSKIDLVITGHKHRFSRTNVGERGNDYAILTIGLDQVASITASESEIRVTVTGRDGSSVDGFTVPRRNGAATR